MGASGLEHMSSTCMLVVERPDPDLDPDAAPSLQLEEECGPGSETAFRTLH